MNFKKSPVDFQEFLDISYLDRLDIRYLKGLQGNKNFQRRFVL